MVIVLKVRECFVFLYIYCVVVEICGFFLVGCDLLVGLNYWKDINVVVGLFWVYFRELEDFLFFSLYY